MSRLTQDTTKIILNYVYKTVTFYGRTFQSVLLLEHNLQRGPTTPTMPKQCWFGLFPVRSPLLRKSLLFSFPAGTKMFQFPALASILDDISSIYRVAPFGNLRIKGYLHLPEAYRSLSRPSSPLRAKASAIRPYLLISYLYFFQL